ncbi:MAG: capsule biosynthesis protein CapC [Sphaerochaetaceae bacterium]|nr:capsule biosynthesis protein CapC [Sphaerochaetaceae bacterium]
MGYIDIHSHLLFGVDHGVQTRQEYLELLDKYAECGFECLVLTPHLFHPTVHTRVENIRKNFLQASEDASRVGIRVLLGSELYLDSQIEVKTIPFNGRFALVEFPVDRRPFGLGRKLSQITEQNLEPVIAHIERYRWLTPDSKDIDMFKENGAWIQVNVSGIENRSALKYIDRDLVDIIADDNHGNPTLPGRLKKALDAYPEIRYRMESMQL